MKLETRLHRAGYRVGRHPHPRSQRSHRRTGAGGLARVRPRVHALAEAAYAAEHRHRWGRRSGSAAGRLGGCDRRAQRRRGLPVRARVSMDAAALLGALADDQGRLRANRRTDASRGQRGGGDATPDPHLLGGARRREPAAGRHRTPRNALPGLGGRPRRRLHRACGAPVDEPEPAGGTRPLPRLARLSGAPVRRDGGGSGRRCLSSQRCLRRVHACLRRPGRDYAELIEVDAMDRKRASRNIRSGLASP